MDLDAYLAAHYPQWRRLEELAGRRGLTGAEADELIDLYERVSTHLSVVRTASPDPSVVAYLSGLLARARLGLAGRRTSSWTDVTVFFTETFPAALYRLRRWWIAVLVANVVAGFVLGWWVGGHPQMYADIPREQIDALVNHDFEHYYSEYAHHEFATGVWINNAWVAALCIALGVLGVPVVYLLWQNIANVAIIGSLMYEYDRAGLFWGLILPHGMLELTAVFVAAGAGLKLFWSWIEPDRRSRLDSFAATGRTVIAVALGLVVVLLVSGIIEGFVTPSDLPPWARIAIGAFAELLFLAYVFGPGRRAAERGVTGDVAPSLMGARAPVA